MWKRLCEWMRCSKLVQVIFWHEDLGSFEKNLAASAGSKRWIFYWIAGILALTLGTCLLLKQIFPESKFVVSEIHVEVYLISAGIYAAISQMDIWFVGGDRKFLKGECIFGFWLAISLASFCIHFLTKGMYPVPEELLDIWKWIGGFFLTSVLSASIKVQKSKQNGDVHAVKQQGTDKV